MNPRKELESQILSACLNYEGQAYSAVDILRPTNFQDTWHRELFTVIFEITGTRPLDLLTVATRYHQRFPDRKDFYKITVLSDSCFISNLTFHCLRLLEMDIREKTLTILDGKEKKYSKSEEFNLAAIMKQTADHIRHPETDIFTGLDNIYNYLKEHLQHQADDIKGIIDAIPQVVTRVRSGQRISYLIDQLTTITNQNTHSNNKQQVAVLRDAMILLLHSNTSPDYITEATYTLSKKLYDSPDH